MILTYDYAYFAKFQTSSDQVRDDRAVLNWSGRDRTLCNTLY